METNLKQVSKNNEQTLLEVIKSDVFLVDVRTREEFLAGSVSGAVNIPLDTIPNRLEEFKDKKNIVVFCRSGNRSGQAKNILEQNGIQNVFNGGTWQEMNEITKHFNRQFYN